MPMLLIDPASNGLLTLKNVLASTLSGLYNFGVGVNARIRYDFPPYSNSLRPEGRRGSQAQCYASAIT
jgi:hypothetical protein